MRRYDQVLDKFEDDVKRLKLEYDIFFNGGSNQYPQKFHEQLDADVKRLFNLPLMSYAQRFRLTTLASRLSTYNDLWQRNLRNLEEGRPLSFVPQPEPRVHRRVEISVGSEPDRESLDQLFQEYCRARERVGKKEPIDPLRFDEMVVAKVRAMQEQKSCSEVVFLVSIEEGDVKLKARPKR